MPKPVRPPWRLCLFVPLLGLTGACIQDPAQPAVSNSDCRLGQVTIPVTDIPLCLSRQGVLSEGDGITALSILTDAVALRDSVSVGNSAGSFWRTAEMNRAFQRVIDYFDRAQFTDSARFHRMLDHVLVTEEYVRGTLRWIGPSAWPDATPFLSWSFYSPGGMQFQAVNTVQSVAPLFPRSTVPTDSLLGMGEQLYRYALWRQYAARRYPVWEYNFTFSAGGVTLIAPWISGLAQGYGIILFTELYRRTGDPLWRDRAYETLESYKVTWDNGGVLLPDTTHGYWWAEYHPTVRVWNGAAQATLAVGELWEVTRDPEVKRMFDRGIESIKYYTHLYDTGTWTLYSRTQWYNTVSYHNSCVRILDALFTVSGDGWFKSLADRWRAYTPPPGVT